MSLHREYELSDLIECALLEVGYTDDHSFTPCKISDDHHLMLTSRPKTDFSCGLSPSWVLITDRVRSAMEAEGLADDATFVPTLNAKRPDQPVWRLKSRRTMPPVSPSMMLTLTDGSPFSAQYEKPCYRWDGLFHLQAELHYRAADVEQMGPFDLAHTKEIFGESPTEEFRPIVVSAHFYDMCRRHKFTGGFRPVRIDP